LWHIIIVTVASALLGLAIAAHSAPAQDLRSPDARDAAVQSQPASAADLRSPDARDAAQPGYGAPSPSDDASRDFTWVYLTIGGLAVALLVGGTTTTRHRRRRVKHPVVATDG
jgi:hypothetical protein